MRTRGERSTISRRDDYSRARSVAATLCLLVAVGCEGRSFDGMKLTSSAPGGVATATSEQAQPPEEQAQPPEAAAGSADRLARFTVAMPRKIIYNAQIEIVVESMAGTADALARLVKENDGYISETDTRSYSQQHTVSTWKVRVPVDRFDAFLARVSRLGELQKNHLDSQDVTQEYYDLEARIANKQVEEKRLIKHLEDSTGKLEDILAVERELSRVRGEVEQMQGRIRYLANLSTLSTVTITATELKDYKPPVSPTFRTQVARAFGGSVESLVDFAKLVVLLLAAAVPWLPVAALLATPVWWLVHRRRNRRPDHALPGSG